MPDPFPPGLCLTGREALKIPHTHTHTDERALSPCKFGVEWPLSAQPQQLQPSLRWSRRCHTPAAPAGRAPSACLLYSFINILIVLQAGNTKHLKDRGK